MYVPNSSPLPNQATPKPTTSLLFSGPLPTPHHHYIHTNHTTPTAPSTNAANAFASTLRPEAAFTGFAVLDAPGAPVPEGTVEFPPSVLLVPPDTPSGMPVFVTDFAASWYCARVLPWGLFMMISIEIVGSGGWVGSDV